MSLLGPAHYRRPPPTSAGRAARRSTTALQFGALAAGVCAVAQPAAAQELRYSLTPTVEQLRFDEALGLENSYLYGGRAGVLFGRIVELQGFYLTSRGTDARAADLYARLNVSGTPPQNPGIDVSTYGANLVLNFGTGLVTPFVRGGGSIVRFAPTGLSATDRIALQYAGGLRVGRPGGIRLSAFAEDVRFRVDRTLLLAIPVQADGAVPFDGDAEKLRSNLAFGAGLTIPLGGAVGAYDDRPTSSLSRLSLPLDAFAGVLDWNGDSGLKAQNIAGVRTGIDFGPLVGLRAYYWRGVDGDFSRRDGVQSWGAEAQFNLNSGSGVTPFLLGGAGQIDFTGTGVRSSGATAADAPRARPADRTALIVGGGVKLPLTPFVSLTAAARDYVTTRDSSRLQDANGTRQLRNNWQYTAGLSVSLGRRTAAPRVATRTRTDTVYLDPTGRRTTAHDTTRTLVVTARGDTLRGAAADSALGIGTSARLRAARGGDVVAVSDTTTIAPTAGDRTYATDRTVAVVVPREGEITVRYGPAAPIAQDTRPGAGMRDEMREEIRAAVRMAIREEMAAADPRARAELAAPGSSDARPRPATPSSGRRLEAAAMTRDEMRAAIRAAIREELAAPGATRAPVRKGTATAPDTTPAPVGPNDAALDGDAADAERDRRLLDRVDARVSERLAAEARAAADARTAAARASSGDGTTVVGTPMPPATRRSFSGATIYSGATFSGGTQALVGGRFDLGQLSARLPGFHLVPELAFGTGSGGTTALLAANATYRFGGARLGLLGDVRPHAGLGVGVLHYSAMVGGREGTNLVLNPAYGVTLDPAPLRPLLRALSVGGVPPALLVEHHGVGFFDVNRLVLGIDWRR